MKIKGNLPETIPVSYGGVAEGAVVIQSWKAIDPHEDTESQVSLELICCDLVPSSIPFISHHLISIQICLFDDGTHEGWGEHELKDFRG